MKELIEKIQQAYDAFSAEAALQVEKGVRRCGVHLSSFQEYVWHSISESSLQFGSDIIAENTDVSIPTSVFQSYYLLLL